MTARLAVDIGGTFTDLAVERAKGDEVERWTAKVLTTPAAPELGVLEGVRVVLGRAGIARARALIACTANDALNLEIGLIAQAFNEQCRGSQTLRVVLRCFDADLARRIHAVSSNYTLLSEAAIASPVFVRKALATEAC